MQGIVLRCSSIPATYEESEYYASAGGLKKIPRTLNPVTGALLAGGIVVAVKVPLC